MQGISINVKKREGKKKGYVKKLRRKGIVPGILYGPDETPTLIEVDKKELEAIFRKHKTSEHFLVSFQLGSKKNVLAFIKDVQYDPVSGQVIHIDLEAVSLKKPMEVVVPLEFVGTPEGVKKGGVFTSFLREIEVKGIVTELPEVVRVDVSNLDLGDTIHIRDIKLENIEVLNDPDEPVAAIHVPRLVEEKAAPAEAQQAAKVEDETPKAN